MLMTNCILERALFFSLIRNFFNNITKQLFHLGLVTQATQNISSIIGWEIQQYKYKEHWMPTVKKIKANIGIYYITHSFNQMNYHENSTGQFGLTVRNTSLITCICSEGIRFTSLQVNIDKTRNLFGEEKKRGNRNS